MGLSKKSININDAKPNNAARFIFIGKDIMNCFLYNNDKVKILCRRFYFVNCNFFQP